MGHATKKDREEFVAVLTEVMLAKGSNPIGAATVARNLMRWGATQSRIAVALCNGEMDQDEYDKQTQRLREKAAPICTELGIKPSWGGDPRGYTLKLILPTGRYNTMGGKEDGWGVPTS